MADYLAYLDKLAEAYGIPREEARAIYELETGKGRNVHTSSAGAQGQMQLMPGTARDMGVTDINDPLQNIRGGVQYYAQQRKRFGDPMLAAAAYNAGPGRVQRSDGVPAIPETQRYVARFQNLLGVKPTQPSAPQAEAPMNEDDFSPDALYSDTLAVPGMADGADEGDLGGGDLSAIPGYADWHHRQQEYTKSAEATRKDQFERGKQMLEQMYGGPSKSARLLALSQAFLAPRPYAGFAGTMYNITKALSGTRQQAEEAQQQRAQAMLKLQQAYESGNMEAQGSALDRELKLIELMARQRKTRTGFNPVTGVLTDLDTGTPIQKEPPTLTPQQAAVLAQDPRNRGMRFKTTDGQERYIH